MGIDTKDFRVQPGTECKLGDWPTVGIVNLELGENMGIAHILLYRESSD